MARVVLLTGGNSGDVKRTLQAAQQLVNAKVGAVLRCSHRYETKPWGFDADGVFSNQALEVSTDLLPLEVLDAVQAIERELGRNRAAEAVEKARTGVNYTSRPIDIALPCRIRSWANGSSHSCRSARSCASAAIRLRGGPWGRCSKSFVTSKFRR